jgi:alpha-beta hydrolase superfamily lysophospholipase
VYSVSNLAEKNRLIPHAGVEEAKDYLKMSDGFNLFVRHWKAVGRAEKSIVCIHGLGCHSEFFKPIGENLAANGVEVYALDLRGFGNSKEEDLPRGDTRDFKRHLQDVDETVSFIRRSNQAQKVYMLGHSLGGLYTLWYAANHPDALDGVILAAPAIESGIRPPPLKVGAGPPFAPETTIDMYEAWPQSLKESEEGKMWRQDPLSTTRFSWRWLGGSMILRDKEALQNASRIRKPTLIIQGEVDDLDLLGGAKRLFESLAAEDKSLRTFPDANHWFYDAIFPEVTTKYSPEKRELVFSTVKGWLKTN